MWNPHKQLSKGVARTLTVLAILGFLGLWGAISAADLFGPAFLPSPGSVAEAFWRLAKPIDGESQLWGAAVWSVTRIVSAVALMAIIGVPAGILLGASPTLNQIFAPLIDPLKSAPIVAFLPLFVMWFGIEEKMKIFFLFFGGVVYLIPMVRDAIQSVRKDFYIQAHDIGFTPFETVRHVLIPLAMPRILEALTVAFGICWTYIVVAEYVNAREGLGHLIQISRRLSATDQVFALIIVILALAWVTDSSLRGLKRLLYPWSTE